MESGYRKGDYNGKEAKVASLFQTTTQQGERASTAFSYLHPSAHRKNLKVITEAQVTRILFSNEDNKRAIGVEYFHNGKVCQIMAKKEVVLSAGAIHSPQLLQLSGIGPADDLKKLKIELIKVLK